MLSVSIWRLRLPRRDDLPGTHDYHEHSNHYNVATIDDTSADDASADDTPANHVTPCVHLWHRRNVLSECDRRIHVLRQRYPTLLQRSMHGSRPMPMYVGPGLRRTEYRPMLQTGV